MKPNYIVTDDGDAFQVAFMVGSEQVAGMIIPILSYGPSPDELHRLAMSFGEFFKQAVQVKTERPTKRRKQSALGGSPGAPIPLLNKGKPS